MSREYLHNIYHTQIRVCNTSLLILNEITDLLEKIHWWAMKTVSEVRETGYRERSTAMNLHW